MGVPLTVYLSVLLFDLFICNYTFWCMFLSVCVTTSSYIVYVFVRPSVCLSIRLYAYFCDFVCYSVGLYVFFPSVRPSVCLVVCQSVRTHVCRFDVCMHVRGSPYF